MNTFQLKTVPAIMLATSAIYTAGCLAAYGPAPVATVVESSNKWEISLGVGMLKPRDETGPTLGGSAYGWELDDAKFIDFGIEHSPSHIGLLGSMLYDDDDAGTALISTDPSNELNWKYEGLYATLSHEFFKNVTARLAVGTAKQTVTFTTGGAVKEVDQEDVAVRLDIGAYFHMNKHFSVSYTVGYMNFAGFDQTISGGTDVTLDSSGYTLKVGTKYEF